MIRLQFSIELNYEIFDASSDFIFNIHAAQTPHQMLVTEQLHINQALRPDVYTDRISGMRHMRLQGVNGTLQVNYQASVDISHHMAAPETLFEMPIWQLPRDTLAYIYPSRYCQSDRLRNFANTEFGHLPPGYWRVNAIQDWVRARTTYRSNTSDTHTSALDTITDQSGVCRDFAHLMIALCRALNIPARFVSGIDYGALPSMACTDLHAYVEVMLSGRWYLFDPSGVSPPMGLLRIGTGRDAADAAFATVFGCVSSGAPVVEIIAIADEANGFHLPHYTGQILSTAIASSE